MTSAGRGGRGRWLLATLAVLVAAPSGVRATPGLGVRDDRGKPIDEPLEVCFQVELRTDCQHLAPGAAATPPAAFQSLRIEGEHHGPLELRREQLRPASDGSLQLALPRKALLDVGVGSPRTPLTVSLYVPSDPTFRNPTFRGKLEPAQHAIYIPAGEFIASLSMPGSAPDLSRLTAAPGGRVHLAAHPRPGWSLLVRCTAAGTSQPVREVALTVAEALGFGRPDRPLARSISGVDGLVLISGIAVTMASLAARHPGYLETGLHGLTAAPGTFAFRDLTLARGGRLSAHVSLHGRPVSHATCQLSELWPEAPDRRDPYRKLWHGETDARGGCRSQPLPTGLYRLRVGMPPGSSGDTRWVNVEEEQDTDLDIALVPTRVSGNVRRAGSAAPGYSVQALPIKGNKPRGARADIQAEAASDEAGRYELTLWSPGWYSLVLRSPSGAVVPSQPKDLATLGDEDQTIDFDLAAESLRGQVIDERAQPVEQAAIDLQWASMAMRTTTDKDGNFQIDLQGEGSGNVIASKPGYRPSDKVDIATAADRALPPLVLVLKKNSTARARVVLADGNPVAGAWVASTGSTPETGPYLYQSTRTIADGSFEIEVPAGPPHLFVSGPGCPLSAFDLAPPDDLAGAGGAPLPSLRCPELPSALDLTLMDERGKPVPHATLILRRQETVVPRQILAGHLMLLGLPVETDGRGHLVVAGLAPGDYELFLATYSSESTVAAGLRHGYLTSIGMSALATTELLVTVPPGP
jgi:hypothetical protein